MNENASHILDAPVVANLPKISDYDEIREILTSRNFVQGAYSISGRGIMDGTVSAIDGEEQLARRRVLARLFDDASVEDCRTRFLCPVVDECLHEIASVATLDPRGSVGIDLVPLVQRSLHRLGAAIAGIDGLDSPDRVDRFMALIRKIAEGATADWTRDDPARVLSQALEARDRFEAEFFRQSHSLRARAAAGALSGDAGKCAGDDILSLMIRHPGPWQGKSELMLRDVVLFIVASTQSTAGGLVTFILRLEKWFESHPQDRQLIERDPEFLRRAAFESLRLTTGAPARIRMATGDVTLSSGRKIKAGERVALLLVAANGNVIRFGDDAGQFNPHRIVQGIAPWGLAFGGGAHTCPGRPLITGSRAGNNTGNNAGNHGGDRAPGGMAQQEGAMVEVARRFYAAGMALDREHPPERDPATHYEAYVRVPVRFSRLATRLS